MKIFHKSTATLALILLSTSMIAAQDLSKYRSFSLGAGLGSISKQVDATPNDVSVVHQNPALIQELVSGRRREDPLAVLSPREREVLELMAEGRTNSGIARQLWLTEGTVEKHVRSILNKLNLPETGDDHRRVRAVITYLESR